MSSSYSIEYEENEIQWNLDDDISKRVFWWVQTYTSRILFSYIFFMSFVISCEHRLPRVWRLWQWILLFGLAKGKDSHPISYSYLYDFLHIGALFRELSTTEWNCISESRFFMGVFLLFSKCRLRKPYGPKQDAAERMRWWSDNFQRVSIN